MGQFYEVCVQTIMSMRKILGIFLVSFAICWADNDPRIINPDAQGSHKQQVYITYKRDGRRYECSGTMITEYIVLTAGHCLKGAHDFAVLPVKQKCKGKVGIPACKVSYWFDDKHEHDIGLMRLSKPMRGMRRLKLSTKTPQPRAKLTMTGTGKTVPSSKDSCLSWKSFQEVDNCGLPSQWFCSKSVNSNKPSGGCAGDSGGPTYNSKGVIVGINAHLRRQDDKDDDHCTDKHTISTNLAFFKKWIRTNMKKLRSCHRRG